MMGGDEDEIRFDWRRGGAAAAGLAAALVLVAMVFMVKFANDAREKALDAERHSYDVSLVVRNASANISGAEAALARFVLDEHIHPNGEIYASDWQLAGFQLEELKDLERRNPDQLRRVFQAEQLYNQRGQQLALAARAAMQNKGDQGVSYYYASTVETPGHPSIGRQLDNKLDEIIKAERESMQQRIEQSQFFSA